MSSKGKEKILVVDDNKGWLSTINNLLQPDYDLTLKSDPLEALITFREGHFSVAILDMNFPGSISGLDLFLQMREISTRLRAIILTGYSDPSLGRKCFQTGIFDYLNKGDSKLFDELKNTIKEAFENVEAEPS